ncbi:hypothetical protein SAMN04488548_1343344 [Gordonia westfalica]|uniref:Uncharacterized protein n=1 Tax=Gordonia westfalica TaxID=158898 RepID=A0A1H2KK94_9ACTN|nr:hypothetical protein SAMN04488548_1343344 [Gordonia westfalica]
MVHGVGGDPAGETGYGHRTRFTDGPALPAHGTGREMQESAGVTARPGETELPVAGPRRRRGGRPVGFRASRWFELQESSPGEVPRIGHHLPVGELLDERDRLAAGGQGTGRANQQGIDPVGRGEQQDALPRAGDIEDSAQRDQWVGRTGEADRRTPGGDGPLTRVAARLVTAVFPLTTTT